MRHLSDEAFVDLLDGTLTERAVPHLDACESCRTQLADLRRTWTQVVDVEVPDPSPLFWDHLAARIREEVRQEPVRPAAQGLLQRLRLPHLTGWRASGLLGAAAAALLVVALRVPWGASPATVPPASTVTTSSDQSVENEWVEVSEPDETLAFVADLASGIDWDAEPESHFTPPGAVDGSLASLSDEERVELRRLLNDALQSGV